MNLRFFLFFLFFFTFHFDIYPQSADEIIKKADELYDFGDYDSSIALYQRILYFSSENEDEIFRKIGDCYFNKEAYFFAEQYYDSALNISNCNSKERLLFNKLDCIIFQKDFDKAFEILNESSDIIDIESEKYNFYSGLILFGNEKYELSESYFIKIFCDTCKLAKDSLDELFDYNFKYPNPELASVLSSIFPGLGQLYAGDYKSAANSFILLSAIVLIGKDMYVKFGLIDPIISVFPWFSRYFKGGIENAYHLAINKKDERRNIILNRIIELVENSKSNDNKEK